MKKFKNIIEDMYKVFKELNRQNLNFFVIFCISVGYCIRDKCEMVGNDSRK